MVRLQTTPPEQALILYDGACKLCTAQAKNLQKLAKGRVRSEALQTALKRFPEISEAEALREIKMVAEDGRVFGGAEAIVQLINKGYPIWGKLLYPYYVPGLRFLADKSYAWVARNRYRLFGKASKEACAEACAIHYKLPEGRS
jgi:predicted DCC family thiol-disulfide oxidoreductase YuxK